MGRERRREKAVEEVQGGGDERMVGGIVIGRIGWSLSMVLE